MKGLMNKSSMAAFATLLLSVMLSLVIVLQPAAARCKKERRAYAMARIEYTHKNGKKSFVIFSLYDAKGDAKSKHISCKAASRKTNHGLLESACNEAVAKVKKHFKSNSSDPLYPHTRACKKAIKNTNLSNIKHLTMTDLGVICPREGVADNYSSTGAFLVRFDKSDFKCEMGQAKLLKPKKKPSASKPKKKTKPRSSARIVSYSNPRVNGYALDYCREWGKNCGKPAADAFCKSKGHKSATDFKLKKNSPPTWVINDRKACRSSGCDRISKVYCLKK